MAVLGIESSAHTFGVGIVEHGKILANCKSMYKISDKGMIPSKVADFHSKNGWRVIKEALDTAGLAIDDIMAVGYTKGPGIGACLRTGQLAARAISVKYCLPIIPVNPDSPPLGPNAYSHVLPPLGCVSPLNKIPL